MDDEKCFELCFPGLFKAEQEKESQLFDLTEMPYKLVFKDISGYYDDCGYCGQNRCGGCPVPFTDQITV